MKRLLLTTLFTLSILCAMAGDQQPLYIIDGKKASLEDVNNLKTKKITSMMVYKNEADVSRYAHLGDVTNGVVYIYTEQEEDDMVWIMVDEMPKFMDGDTSTFIEWIMQNLRYPAKAIERGLQGKITCGFVVDSNGYIDTDALEFYDTSCDEDMILRNEVIRVLSKSPQWTPGKQMGKPVKVKFIIPVSFKLPDSDGNISTSSSSNATSESQLRDVVVVGFGQ